jgi:hypothetical protein
MREKWPLTNAIITQARRHMSPRSFAGHLRIEARRGAITPRQLLKLLTAHERDQEIPKGLDRHARTYNLIPHGFKKALNVYPSKHADNVIPLDIAVRLTKNEIDAVVLHRSDGPVLISLKEPCVKIAGPALCTYAAGRNMDTCPEAEDRHYVALENLTSAVLLCWCGNPVLSMKFNNIRTAIGLQTVLTEGDTQAVTRGVLYALPKPCIEFVFDRMRECVEKLRAQHFQTPNKSTWLYINLEDILEAKQLAAMPCHPQRFSTDPDLYFATAQLVEQVKHLDPRVHLINIMDPDARTIHLSDARRKLFRKMLAYWLWGTRST